MKKFSSASLAFILSALCASPTLAQSTSTTTPADPLFDANTKLDSISGTNLPGAPPSLSVTRAGFSSSLVSNQTSDPANNPINSSANIPVRHLAERRSIAMSTSAVDQFTRMATSNNGVLSSDTLVLAEKIGLMPMMEKLERLRNASKGNPTDSQILQFLLAKQQFMEAILVTGLEVRCTVNNVEAEIDKANDLYAVLAERRDRATLLNTYANLISGGITGMVSGGLALGQVNYIVPNTIDTTEGVIQTAISLLALRQQKGQHELERGTPSILARIIHPTDETAKSFPASVWVYLNTVPSDSERNETRVQRLVRSWKEPDYKRHRLLHYVNEDRTSFTSGKPKRTTVNLLEDRMAMLTDFQTLIAGMEFNLLELTQFAQGQRTLNP